MAGKTQYPYRYAKLEWQSAKRYFAKRDGIKQIETETV
jgi:hypothetical protein